MISVNNAKAPQSSRFQGRAIKFKDVSLKEQWLSQGMVLIPTRKRTTREEGVLKRTFEG